MADGFEDGFHSSELRIDAIEEWFGESREIRCVANYLLEMSDMVQEIPCLLIIVEACADQVLDLNQSAQDGCSFAEHCCHQGFPIIVVLIDFASAPYDF